MRLIAECNERVSPRLEQYTVYIESVGKHYKILEAEESNFECLRALTKSIEQEFCIYLRKSSIYFGKGLVQDNHLVLAYIGSKSDNIQAEGYYNMANGVFKETAKCTAHQQLTRIHCYNNDDKTGAADYIKCISFLASLSQKLNKPVLILANIEITDAVYKYRSLTNKVINEMIKEKAILVAESVSAGDLNKYYTPLSAAYEYYCNRVLYFTSDIAEAFLKIRPFFYSKIAALRDTKEYACFRQSSSLYSDVFYQSINPEQSIYVLLGSGDIRAPDYYETLGLKAIPIMNGYSMLYAKKSQFDTVSSLLRPDVVPQYEMPILSHSVYGIKDVLEKSDYHLVKEELKYKGKGVYIGLVTADEVDYTCKALRKKDGTSRIACIWRQVEADQGEYFFKDQINNALLSDQPEKEISLPKESSISTMMLGIAGGKDQEAGYFGIAEEAEFIVAKINAAPKALQSIYGGMPSENAAITPDIVIGVTKLVDFAAKQGVPLVLCVPFNSNIDSHDGTQILQEILGLIARRTYLTMIVPSGDEADKMHHYGLEGKQSTLGSVSINVTQKNQNIVGIICQRFSTIFSVGLFPPQSTASEAVRINQAGITRLNETVIYSNGEQVSFLDGAGILMFRIENPQIGEWRIEGRLQTEAESQIDIWISQQELNPFVTLRPANAAMTIGSLAAVDNLMTVGGYNKDGMVVLKDSGRGYSWDNRVAPLFITDANKITAPCGKNKWVSITGTLPAAAIMLGTIAVLYSKFIEEHVLPFPNTLVMNNQILSKVKQFEEIEYPNGSQGYGIFDRQILSTLL